MNWRIKMNLTCALWFSVLLAFSPAQTQQSPEQLARQAAGSWLILVDSGKYALAVRAAERVQIAGPAARLREGAVRGVRSAGGW